MPASDERVPVLYLAPWVDIGGTDKNTIDWFRAIDRDRFAPSLIATQVSPNRRLEEIVDFAEEIWVLPDVMSAERMPKFILDFLHSREVGVVHLMNSRLGFDLLPDLTCLPNPPGVVVQLHVEEADRAGYVRYVTTRYGNLVDRFSVSHRDLAEAVHDYGVPRDKTRVIYIGVDAEEEFSPEHVEPVDGLASDCMQILFPARLVEQKDPLLMVEVAAALRERGVSFQLQVLGEGDLEPEVRKRIAALGLEETVLIHPPTATPQRWYAACDAVLMTSVFEGVPAVVYEAMAMGVPIVGPALPGNVELLGEDHDGLVEPRDSVEGYVSALTRLAEDGESQASQGRRLRERARERFSLAQMAAAHGELYEELAEHRAPPRRAERTPGKEPIRFHDRPSGTPLVSILVPHFNQAAFIGECIESIRAQTYPWIETIVVDDASTEADAPEAIAALEAAEDVTVVRQAENGGPSRARNTGLEHCSGSYILPVDADNVLLPDAVEKLVEQLSGAPEDVGFIYPNLQYFGNREDYYEVPSYNLYDLTRGNCCDTCSLLDRRIFDAGERYHEEIRLGHEDWEFVLRLADRGVRGEAANEPTVRYRKWGFNRSDSVEHAPEEFDELLAEISPFRGREAEIKSLERPALSIVPLEPIDAASAAGCELAARLEAQRCIDAELIARFDGDWPQAAKVPPTRRSPAAAGATTLHALQNGLSLSRGRFVALTAGSGGDLLADPSFVERVLRRFDASGDELDAIAFVDVGAAGRFCFRALSAQDCAPDAAPHALVWRQALEEDLPGGLHVDPDDPVGSLAQLVCGAGAWVEWRHMATDRDPAPRRGPFAWTPLGEHPPRDSKSLRVEPPPLLPGAGEYRVPRWEDTPTWMPPMSTLAIRYREQFGQRRVVTSSGPPRGYVPEHHLGALRTSSLEGTARLVRIGDRYEALPRGQWRSAPEGAVEIGYAELAQLPGMDVLALAVHRASGEQTLVTLPADPILGDVDMVGSLGCLDPFPLKPRETPEAAPPWGLVGLTKAVDHRSRRHRYAAGTIADGELIGELGALAESDLQGSIAVWIVAGVLVTERHRPQPGRPRLAGAARWTAEPAAWGGLAPRSTQAKAFARRALMSVARVARPARGPVEPSGDPAGWLFGTARPGRAPLFAAYHPITGDQLLSRSPEDAAHMGYGPPELLGYLRLAAPITGETVQRALPVPWARRFGAVPRSM